MKNQKLHFPFEIKSTSVSEDNGINYAYFEGYGAVFGNTDSYNDIIMRGAFKNTLGKRKVKMLWQHNWDDVIGSFVDLKEDDAGLYVKGRINLGVEKGKEAYALIKSGDMDGLSIGYSTIVSEIDDSEEDKRCRRLKEIELYEISIVTMPANELSTIGNVKSLEEADSLKKVEDILRNNGFSQKESKLLISKVKQIYVSQREAEEAELKNQRDAEELRELLKSIKNTLKA